MPMSILLCFGKNWMNNWDRIGTKHVKNPTRIQIEKAGDFRSKWRTMFIHALSGGKRGVFLSPFLSKRGHFYPPFLSHVMTIMQMLKSIILWIRFLKSEASHSTLFNLDLSAYPSSEKEVKNQLKIKLKSFLFFSTKVVEGLGTI